MNLEEIREEKQKKICELLEEKHVDVYDDYTNDVFKCDETNEEIFRALNWRSLEIHPELIDETLDLIINNLENYEKKIN